MAEATIPFGRSKGTPLSQAETKDIKYWVDAKLKKLNEEPGHQYAHLDKAWLKEAKAVLQARKNGGSGSGGASSAPTGSAAPPAAPNGAIEKRATEQVVGAWHEAGVVDNELKKASESAHLVSPATVCGSLPEGCEVAISVVYVDSNDGKDGPGEVFSVGGGKLALSGVTIKRIGSAAGIDWDMERSGRLDNGSDPHYVHYRAVGYVKNFDGSYRTVSGEVDIDMRDGSPQVVAMKARARDGKNFDSQLRDTRMFILRHAETKAKLRAICDIGIKRSYTKAELDKPFAVARLMATGRTNDPELRKEFARMNFDKMTNGRAALYGGQPPVSALPPRSAPPAFEGHEPPPVGAVGSDDDDFDWPADIDVSGEPVGESVGEKVGEQARDPKSEVKSDAAGASKKQGELLT
jgi:hypothetical protein